MQSSTGDRVGMDLEFRYSCACGEKKRLVVNTLLECSYQQRLNECTNNIVDRSWDEQDTEILLLMSAVLHNLRTSNNVTDDNEKPTSNMMLPKTEMDLAIFKTVRHPATGGCVCEEISHKLSLVLDAGLAELTAEPAREDLLVEKLQLLKPFVAVFEGDIMLGNFFTRSWKHAIQFYLPKLIEELTMVYPAFLHTLINALIESKETDYDRLLLRKDFQYLSRCLTVGRSFYTILSYLAEKNLGVVQPLISACIAFVKGELSSKEYYALFPLRLRPYAIIMNEIISPHDADLEALVERLKKDHPIDYRVLVMISPVFYSLANN